MQKFLTAAALMALAPSVALAHASNDLSHGHAHYLFSWHHLLGIIGLAAVAAGLIWYLTRPMGEEPKEKPVRVESDDELRRR
ncbi:hypothetical protein [Cerasicoccus fimbriatus]|uniref:hypothetical protein n=1 Tax=Cerasicoccus fimbriatus TaxID=3014554 RepID=UPI0022B5C850|nr:hypothetical protein [Cerasicoccus sp. TK19100]